MVPGKAVMDVSCDDGFDLTLTLPERIQTSLPVRRVNADSYGAASSETGDPTTMDVHSVGLGADEAIKVATGVADDLGIDATPLQRWRVGLEASPTDNVDSPFLRSRVGYLTAEMQVQHLGASGTNYVHLVLTWA